MERLIPGGRIEMIFNFARSLEWVAATDSLKGISNANVEFMGQRDRIFFARTTGDVNLLGIRFKPGGINAFTGIPAVSLLNEFTPADNVVRFPLSEWESRLQETASDSDKIKLLNKLLTGAIQPTGKDWMWTCNIVRTIQNEENSSSIYELCSGKGGYYKKLERAFLHYVGYTPKYYSRIIRFNKALREISLQPVSLTNVGYGCGYFDQSHFIKDFRQFTGTTPKFFLQHENTMANLLIQHQAV
jgi:AraC-like DNA-binding protein